MEQKLLVSTLSRLIALCKNCNQSNRPAIGITTRINEIQTILKSADVPVDIKMGNDGKFAEIQFGHANLLSGEVNKAIESIGFDNGVYKF